MLITATQSGLWTTIEREDGLRRFVETIPNSEAESLYHALHAIFQLHPPLEPSETAQDA